MTTPKQDIDECASVWFARLERALTLGDYRSAAEALDRLRRLGWHVEPPGVRRKRRRAQRRPPQGRARERDCAAGPGS